MHSVAIFNNKGGVGKTTLLCNLASALSQLCAKSVLVVDADPQCNATQYMFDDDTIEEIYSKKNSFTLNTIVKPLAAGKGFSQDLVVRRSPRFMVDVIVGDPSMSLAEDLLASDWIAARSGNPRGLRTTFLFTKLLEKCEAYDYVLFDMGPTLGAINRSVLIAADHFLVPMSIDIFSLRALENISIQLQDWRKRLERGLEDLADVSEIEINDPRWKLSFVGYVTQQYKAKSIRGNRRAVSAYEKILSEVQNRVQQHLIDELGADQNAAEMELGSIPLLHSLVPMAQTARSPIFSLSSDDGVRGGHFSRVKDYRTLIQDIATRFIERVESD